MKEFNLKIVIKDGWKLNPQAAYGIIKGLMMSGGECPCQNPYKGTADAKCPCRSYLQDDKCCCNLYIK